jgi:UDP-N-acetylmuramoyl-L-alanyl-D-glutamate--2,6-diaminopimelate ligase
VEGKYLAELAAAAGGQQRGDAWVTGVAYDSRRVRPGDLFCAIRGFRTDGHRFVRDAQLKGAVAALVEDWAAVPPGLPAVRVPNSRVAMARVAAAFWEHPSRKLWMIGVTGTNGKTTTTHLIRAILERGGMPTGLMGTVHTLVGSEEWPVDRTTPEAPDLQATLARMVERGMRAVVMEVSSHALALARVDGVLYDVGVFTNLTQDHLDFHGDFEAYFAAKARLFEGLPDAPRKGPVAAVLNADDLWAGRLVGLTRAPTLTYGIEAPGDVRAEDVRLESGGASFQAVLPDGTTWRVRLPLAGRFNVANALAAMAVGYLAGISGERMAEALAAMPGVPGRFERIDCGQPFAVVVDYAHSPDGIQNVLAAAREVTRGRVIAVFGAGGDRDRTKRPLMGRAAGGIADLVVLTSDNPRSEDPLAIIADIEAGVRETPARYLVEPDRRAAIRRAVQEAAEGDMILILGKGHETYQIFRDRTIHFDDREVSRAILEESGYPCR